MASEETTEKSPFAHPGFIAATLVVAVLAVLAIVVLVNGGRGGDDPVAAPSGPAATESAASAPEESEAPAAQGGKSVCGLGGYSGPNALRPAKAPEVDSWDYVGVMAFATSSRYGPAESDEAGFRYCFEHSPEGALFASAYFVAQGSEPSIEWLEYALAPGTFREETLAGAKEALSSGEALQDPSTRRRLAGFRYLAYDGDTARIDFAFDVSTSQGSSFVSQVNRLVWADGDWKLDTSTWDRSADVSRISSLAGYITWGE